MYKLNKKLITLSILCILFVSVLSFVYAEDQQQGSQPGFIEKTITDVLNKLGLGQLIKWAKILAKIIDYVTTFVSWVIKNVKAIVTIINTIFSPIPGGIYIALFLTTAFLVSVGDFFLKKLLGLLLMLPFAGDTVLAFILEWNIPFLGHSIRWFIEKDAIALIYYSVAYNEAFATITNAFVLPFTIPLAGLKEIPPFWLGALRYMGIYLICRFYARRFGILFIFGRGWLWGKRKKQESKLKFIFSKIETWLSYFTKREKREILVAKKKAVEDLIEEPHIYLLAKGYYFAYKAWIEEQDELEKENKETIYRSIKNQLEQELLAHFGEKNVQAIGELILAIRELVKAKRLLE